MIPLKDSHVSGKFPFWTIGIIVLNVYIFYLELTALNPQAFILNYSLIPADVNSNIAGLFPFITSQFLHAGFIHIISNMIFLWVFGNNVESAFGFWYFPLFYIMGGITAGLTQYFSTPDAIVPMLGASGAVAAVLGAYFALFPNNKIKTLVFIFIFVTFIDIPAWILLFYWFITQLFSGVAALSMNQTGGIAFLPHAGGFLFGWLAATFTLSQKHHIHLKFS